jgi:hypothetical protein
MRSPRYVAKLGLTLAITLMFLAVQLAPTPRPAFA